MTKTMKTKKRLVLPAAVAVVVVAGSALWSCGAHVVVVSGDAGMGGGGGAGGATASTNDNVSVG